MVRHDDLTPAGRGNDVLVDVTSIIGAEDYIVSQNRLTRPGDPFARQSFVELIQSLIFMSRVYVAHPTLPAPKAADFGRRPRLLRALMWAGLLHPLTFDDSRWTAVQRAEERLLRDLKSPLGTRSVVQFVEQALICDDARSQREDGLSEQMRRWVEFQVDNVRQAGHHRDRITTDDGIENDAFGRWARAAALVLEGSLQSAAPPAKRST